MYCVYSRNYIFLPVLLCSTLSKTKQKQPKKCPNVLAPFIPWASYQIRKIAGCACAGNAGNVSPHRRIQRKSLVSDPGMHHGTCVTHVPWCMSGSLTRGVGENVPGIPGACATRNFTYLARGPWPNLENNRNDSLVLYKFMNKLQYAFICEKAYISIFHDQHSFSLLHQDPRASVNSQTTSERGLNICLNILDQIHSEVYIVCVRKADEIWLALISHASIDLSVYRTKFTQNYQLMDIVSYRFVHFSVSTICCNRFEGQCLNFNMSSSASCEG